jgi:hypothetical protein
MFITNDTNNLVKNTSHKVVLPFYLYAAVSFLAATILLFFAAPAFTQHYFHPQILAITHCMALGWGTMIILGASHQLVPVLIEGRLYSNALAYLSFLFAATGIPVLLYGFYFFNMGWPVQWGGIFINVSIVLYLANLVLSMVKSKKENVHAVFVFTAGLWLFLTTHVGLLLAYNFTTAWLPKGSLHYLPLHAHMGIIGWFLLLVTGVGSRLLPMFLISKYSNTKMLWVIYFLMNGGLILFIILFIYYPSLNLYLLSGTAIFAAILLFGWYAYKSFQQRIRKQVDEQMQLSLLSVMMMVIPMFVLAAIIIGSIVYAVNTAMVLVYGFVIFFGWITVIIFGMTFKTLPFIVWNREYHLKAGIGKTPNPKDLFSNPLFKIMSIVYLPGFVLFITGICMASVLMIQMASLFLVLAAVLYNWNVIKMLLHKSRPL